jgi:hypothetical protein
METISNVRKLLGGRPNKPRRRGPVAFPHGKFDFMAANDDYDDYDDDDDDNDDDDDDGDDGDGDGDDDEELSVVQIASKLRSALSSKVLDNCFWSIVFGNKQFK